MTIRSKSGLVWPTVLAAATLLGLLGLGTWQLERKAWKEAIVARIAARTIAEPILLEAAAAKFQTGDDLEYVPLRARGTFLHQRTQFYYAPGKQGPGWHAYTPLETPAGAILIVNRGFVPEGQKAAWLASLPERGEQTDVVGLLRSRAAKGWFTPANDAAKNIWYWRDLDGMADTALKHKNKNVFPFFVETLKAAVPGSGPDALPRGGVTRLELPNRHLEYALTWYGLAAALISVFLVFARARLMAAKAVLDGPDRSGHRPETP